MNGHYLRSLSAALLVASGVVPHAARAQSPIVKAANAFLGTLTDAQRKKAVFAWNDDEQRRRWSNFPTGIVQRAGIQLLDMNATQRASVMSLLQVAFSPYGYQKILQIMEGDEVNKTNEANGRGGRGPGNGQGRGGPPDSGRGGPPNGRGGFADSGRGGPPGGRGGRGGPGGPGGGLLFGKDLYYISFVGAPSETTPWMLQFGGHHLALNVTMAGDRGVLTPTLTGAQPALYTVDGKTYRPLDKENSLATALWNSLDATQQKSAMLSYRVADLVLGPGQDGKTIQPEGLKASAMTASQRAMLVDLITQWSNIIYPAAAATRLAEIKAGLADTWFAWSGSTTPDANGLVTGYYRVQGPNLVIEYAPQGGDPTHVHTMYRDPTNDYGRKFTGQ